MKTKSISRKKTIVIGVGNPLLSDEGIGSHAIARLRRRRLPSGTQLCDAGVSLEAALSLAEGFDKMVIVDAVKGGDRPGAIYRFTLEELEAGRASDYCFRLSLHEMDVPKAIALERLVVNLPKQIIFIGMEPKTISPGEKLSRAVEKKMGLLVSCILQELKK